MRIVADMNPEWKFRLGEEESTRRNNHVDDYYSAKAGKQYNPGSKEWDDDAWETVNLPHDYLSGAPFSPEASGTHGFRVAENAWYRKTFFLPPAWRGRHLLLSFEGIVVHSVIYFNGSLLCRNNSAYTEANVDITDRAYFGDDRPNTVAVYVDGKATEGWWYEGAGLYRHVKLYVKDVLHLEHNGVFVSPSLIEGTENDWMTKITAEVANSGYEALPFRLRARLFFEGEPVAEGISEEMVSFASDTTTAEFSLKVKTPARWDVDSPRLYEAKVELLGGEETLDEGEGEGGAAEETEPVDGETVLYGYRTFLMDAGRGFFLNGRHILLKGTCNHQDHAGVGVAVPDSIQDFRIRKLKEMGCNAYRCAHNPPARALLDACDRYGLIVMDENRRFEASPEALGHLANMVTRDRNHPSVIFYSLFNEEPLQNNEEGAAIFRRQRALVEKLDATRLIMGAMNGNMEGAGQYMDAVGINYYFRGLPEQKEKYPHLPVFGSENCSTLATRGCYKTCNFGRLKHENYHVSFDMAAAGEVLEMSDYDEEMPPWGSGVRDAWRFVQEHPYFGGIFIWTGFDYRGEPTPFTYPAVSSQFGLMDTCGHPKEAYYFARACYAEAPMLHLLPHWNFEPGEVVRVMTVTNCPEVELFLNGHSLGRRASDVLTQNEWQVPFEAGVLEAVAYRDGREILRTARVSAGEPVALKLMPDRRMLLDDGQDTVQLSVCLVDADGNIVPTAKNKVRFIAEGGVVRGTGNGDPISHEDDTRPERRLFAGYCAALVSATPGAKLFRLTVSSEGLPDATLDFTVVEAPERTVIRRAVNTVLSAITVSEVSAERPDPCLTVADNDMNSFTPLAMSENFQEDFTDGWRIYRIQTRMPGSTDGGTRHAILLAVSACADRAEVYLNGELLTKTINHFGPLRADFTAAPGTALDFRILLHDYDRHPSGLRRAVRLMLGL